MKSFKQTATIRCMTVILSAVLVVTALGMSGCTFRSLLPSIETPDTNGPTVIPDTTDKNSPPEQGGGEEEPALPAFYDPLTGLGTEVDLSALRPVAFSFSTESAIGIADAKILIEAPIENGTTRLFGISNTYPALSSIGGIRPTRPYLLSLADAFSAVAVHAGERESGGIKGTLPSIDYTDSKMGTVFYRNPSYAAPLDVFTSGTRLIGAMESFEKCGASLPYSLVPYGESVTPTGGGAKSVLLPFSATQLVGFNYDEESGHYLRRQNGAAHTDGASGEQLGFTNLLLLVCESAIYNKASGTELDLNVTGGGTGYYVTNGSYTRITWERESDGSLLLLDESGSEIAVNRGKTYIGLLDILNASSVMIVD